MPSQRLALDYNKLCIMVIIGALSYSEYFAYYSNYIVWPGLPISMTPNGESDAITILFVGDPQIQGYLNEGSLGFVRRWDIDRYLSKTFGWAIYSYKPDVVVFLGDLLDEGYEADHQSYLDYVSRFKAIYGLREIDGKVVAGTNGADAVFVPGDNDIGGEGSDVVTQDKMDRFFRHFPSRPLYSFRSKKNPSVQFEVIPVNILVRSDVPTSWLRSNGANTSHVFRVVVTHFPIIPLMGSFAKDVQDYLHPSIIFSAHDHRGKDFIASRNGAEVGNFTYFSQKKRSTNGDFLPLSLLPLDRIEEILSSSNDSPSNVDGMECNMHEIIVPTCSYRMGVEEMAFGLGIVELDISPSNLNKDPKLVMHYANLWLPNRFALLFVYVAAILVSTIICVIGKVKNRGKRPDRMSGRRSRRGSSGSPSPRSRSFSRSPHFHHSKLV